MNIHSSFPSKYLKAEADFGDDDMILTMDTVQIEDVGTAEEPKDKPVLYFAETEKGLVLNKTNSATIAGLYGAETDAWQGKKIRLFAQEVDFQGRQVLAIRVRLRKPQPAPQTQQARPEPVAQAAGGRGGRPAPTPEENEADPFADNSE